MAICTRVQLVESCVLCWMLLLLDYKFILVEFGIFKTRSGVLYSWKVDFVDYTRDTSGLFHFCSLRFFRYLILSLLWISKTSFC